MTNRPAGPDQVVVGVSAGLAGLHALRYAVAEARRQGAVLHAVRACGFSPAWTGPDVERIRAELRVEARRQTLAAFDDAMGGVPGDITVQIDAISDRADRALVAAVRGPGDLLVLGMPGRRKSFWLFKACARHAGCPVVAVPAPHGLTAGDRRAGRRLVRELLREVRSSGSVLGRP